MNNVFLLTGGNIGDRVMNLHRACQEIENHVGIIVKKSSVYETEAWGYTDQSPFLNQVLQVFTALSPQEVLQTILDIESEMGRERVLKMGPRIIDIDILFYEDFIIQSSNLMIPHPEIQNRRFALTPMEEIAPSFFHPLIKKDIKLLLKECKDSLIVKPYLPIIF